MIKETRKDRKQKLVYPRGQTLKTGLEIDPGRTAKGHMISINISNKEHWFGQESVAPSQKTYVNYDA